MSGFPGVKCDRCGREGPLTAGWSIAGDLKCCPECLARIRPQLTPVPSREIDRLRALAVLLEPEIYKVGLVAVARQVLLGAGEEGARWVARLETHARTTELAADLLRDAKKLVAEDVGNPRDTAAKIVDALLWDLDDRRGFHIDELPREILLGWREKWIDIVLAGDKNGNSPAWVKP